MKLTPQEAKASLGVATSLLDKHIASQAPAPQQEQETQQPETENAPQDLDAKFKEFEKTVATMIDEKIGGLKNDIQSALKEPNE